MTQVQTFRSEFRTLPGHIYTPEGAGRETESLMAPFTLQQITFTVGAGSPAGDGVYSMLFVTPANGTITVSVAAVGVATPTALAVLLAAAANNDPVIGQLFTFTSATNVVTGIAKSANLSIPAPTTSIPGGGNTLTGAISVAAGAPSLRMGLWYQYGTAAQPYAITGSPRGCRIASLPNGSSTIAGLRGVIARVVNQTTLSPTFIDSLTNDAYVAGQIFPGALRSEVCTVVDPASPTMTVDGQVHVVIAAGVYSVIGAVASVADGGNTLRLDNTSGVIRARVTAVEEVFTMSNYTGRCVVLEVNQTN